MADETPPTDAAPEPIDGPTGDPGAAAGQPRIVCLSQYVKDLSFESPGSPATVMQGGADPKGELKVDLKVHKLGNDTYEVVLHFDVEATKQDQTAFLVELHYAGVFKVTGVAEANIDSALMVESPRNLYPFARRIIADAVRDGGFPQLMLGHINFAQLFQMYGPNAQTKGGINSGADAAATETTPETTPETTGA